MDLPYKADYAKSGRAKCKRCKSTIAQGTLRLALMFQSPVHDDKIPEWYHEECFFDKQRPETVADIEGFELLRVPDQKKIKEKLDFSIGYSKSSSATCRGCKRKIMEEQITVSKKALVVEKSGGQDKLYHLGCFSGLRAELGYIGSASAMRGYQILSEDDQKEANVHISAFRRENIPPETEELEFEEPSKTEKLFEEQSSIYHNYRDLLSANLKKTQLIQLLKYNMQEVPPGKENILHRLADIMTFGTLEPCHVCKCGQYVYDKLGYKCQEHLTGWSKCNNITKTPKRSAFKIPQELAGKYSFLNEYEYVPRTRIFKYVNPPNNVKKGDDSDEKTKVEREAPPLYNMEFVILGKPNRGKDVLKEQITKLGGKVTTTIRASVMAVIASVEEVEQMDSCMREVERNDIQVVPESFVDDVVGKTGQIPKLIIEKQICEWGSNPETRLPPEPTTSSKSKTAKSIYESVPSKRKLIIKDGSVVLPKSGLAKEAHVYQDGDDKFTAVLGKTDIQSKKNSFYNLQLLESDTENRFWVFREWGRIGTTIGLNKVEIFFSLHLAKRHYCELYEKKTGNMWEDRHDFVKIPERYYPVDVDYGEDDRKVVDITDSPSSLDSSVENLMRIIFDTKRMMQTMLELELDTEKMPLGKLSKQQILSAYEILSELQSLLDSEKSIEFQLIDASNRFYTFIPHNFGVKDPPVLKTSEMIKEKIKMLDNLMELEVAYSLMNSAESDSKLDYYYSKLNTDIKAIDRKSEEFQIIQEYVANTHAETHKRYELEIVDLFAVKRQGEDKRFEPFKKLHNRMLLWHGSRTINFAGILSRGLRIAPPEAPSTGYMFGKGVYFADVVSKSANYCFTSPRNSHGLLLLCEVALGNMYELIQAEYIEELPPGKHSTKGLGKIVPDPRGSKKLGDVEVPLGKLVQFLEFEKRDLLYNEYVVYDVAHVRAKYLVKVNFKFKQSIYQS